MNLLLVKRSASRLADSVGHRSLSTLLKLTEWEEQYVAHQTRTIINCSANNKSSFLPSPHRSINQILQYTPHVDEFEQSPEMVPLTQKLAKEGGLTFSDAAKIVFRDGEVSNQLFQRMKQNTIDTMQMLNFSAKQIKAVDMESYISDTTFSVTCCQLTKPLMKNDHYCDNLLPSDVAHVLALVEKDDLILPLKRLPHPLDVYVHRNVCQQLFGDEKHCGSVYPSLAELRQSHAMSVSSKCREWHRAIFHFSDGAISSALNGLTNEACDINTKLELSIYKVMKDCEFELEDDGELSSSEIHYEPANKDCELESEDDVDMRRNESLQEPSNIPVVDQTNLKHHEESVEACHSLTWYSEISSSNKRYTQYDTYY